MTFTIKTLLQPLTLAANALYSRAWARESSDMERYLGTAQNLQQLEEMQRQWTRSENCTGLYTR